MLMAVADFFSYVQYLKTDPGPDFLKCSTIVKIKKHLNTMDAELQKKFK